MRFKEIRRPEPGHTARPESECGSVKRPSALVLSTQHCLLWNAAVTGRATGRTWELTKPQAEMEALRPESLLISTATAACHHDSSPAFRPSPRTECKELGDSGTAL